MKNFFWRNRGAMPGAIACALISAFPAHAEPHTKPREFYEKNFAEAPGDNSSRRSEVEQLITQPRAGENAPSNNIEPVANPQEDLTQKAIRQARERLAGGAAPAYRTPTSNLRIKKVGAIFNAENHSYIETQLSELQSFLDRSSLGFDTIYLIGNRSEVPMTFKAFWGLGGGRIFFMDQLPPKYAAVKRSPSWILSAEDQQVIIEGLGPITQHLTKEGKIISAVYEATPTPAGTVSPVAEVTQEP